MEPITVFVTGIGGVGHGEQIYKALRLAKTSYTIIGGDISPYAKPLLEVDVPYLLPPVNDPDYLTSVLGICDKHNVSALFHGTEGELKVMSEARDAIHKKGLFLPINPAHVIDLCMDKVKTCEFLKANGFRVPAYQRITRRAELEEFQSLPAVIKPSRGGGGSANAFLAQTKEELFVFGSQLLSIYPEFIIQEYVGTPDSEFTVGVLVSMDGEFLNSIAVKRNILVTLSNRLKVPNRTERHDLGPVLALSSGMSQGEIGQFPEVTRTCEEIAMRLGCRGAINIQCRLVGDEVFIFEINPRFSGTTSLRAMVGYNEPDVLIRKHLLGEHIEPHFSYQSGVIVRSLTEVLFKS